MLWGLTVCLIVLHEAYFPPLPDPTADISSSVLFPGVLTGTSNPITNTGIGGFPIGNYRQFYIQLAYVVATTAYAFVVSALLAWLIGKIPGLHLRASDEAELLGMDDDQGMFCSSRQTLNHSPPTKIADSIPF